MIRTVLLYVPVYWARPNTAAFGHIIESLTANGRKEAGRTILLGKSSTASIWVHERITVTGLVENIPEDMVHVVAVGVFHPGVL